MIQLIQLTNTSGIQAEEQFRQFFESCFHLYYESLHRYAYTIIKDNQDASDIVQIVFAKWWERGDTLIIQHDIRHYLYRTVHNQCLNYVRNRKNRKTDLREFGTGAVDLPDSRQDPIISKEFASRMNQELNNLPPQCKLIFYKSRFENKKYSEIATELNLSIKTVETQIGKALRILRQKLFDNNTITLAIIFCLLNKFI